MSGQFGIQNTKEVIQLAGKVTSLILRKNKLGAFKAVTLVEFMLSDEFRTAVIDAATGITEVPDEVRDLQASEVFELAKASLQVWEGIVADIQAA